MLALKVSIFIRAFNILLPPTRARAIAHNTRGACNSINITPARAEYKNGEGLGLKALGHGVA